MYDDFPISWISVRNHQKVGRKLGSDLKFQKSYSRKKSILSNSIVADVKEYLFLKTRNLFHSGRFNDMRFRGYVERKQPNNTSIQRKNQGDKTCQNKARRELR